MEAPTRTPDHHCRLSMAEDKTHRHLLQKYANVRGQESWHDQKIEFAYHQGSPTDSEHQ
jgi:hypothetical protein